MTDRQSGIQAQTYEKDRNKETQRDRKTVSNTNTENTYLDIKDAM